MSYEPTNWNAGDVVTAAKLNKLEQGVAAGGTLVVTATVEDETTSLDKTWAEINAAAQAGQVVMFMDNSYIYYLCQIYTENGVYYANFDPTGTDTSLYFTTDDASGYPSYTHGGR